MELEKWAELQALDLPLELRFYSGGRNEFPPQGGWALP